MESTPGSVISENISVIEGYMLESTPGQVAINCLELFTKYRT